MQTLLAILFLFSMQSGSAMPSPFGGTWIIDSAVTQLPDRATVLLLANGIFGSAGQQIKADGTDQKVPETGYWDTMNVQILDAQTVKIISKKAGKTMFTEVDMVSADNKTLTQIVEDTTEARTVTIETVSKRLEKSSLTHGYTAGRCLPVTRVGRLADHMPEPPTLARGKGKTQCSM